MILYINGDLIQEPIVICSLDLYIYLYYSPMIQEKATEDKTRLLKLEYYRTADVVKGWFWDTFDIRFEEIKNSLVDMGLLRTIYHLLRWRINYTSLAVPTD